MTRWTTQEKEAIKAIRSRCQHELQHQTPYPEVTGDRRILRFYNGFHNDIDKTSYAYATFLKWRKDNNIDLIREDIISGRTPYPSKFPSGAKIMKICPQIVLSTKHRDKQGRPITFEKYDFPMKEFLEQVPLEEFYLFILYTSEYRSLVLEQLSDENEQEYLRLHPDPKTRKSPYGVLLSVCSIRDLHGVTMSHIGYHGRTIASAALKLVIPNYPEATAVSYHVNCPIMFSVFWHFVKGFLDERLLSMVKVSATHTLDVLQEAIAIDDIPALVGGNFVIEDEEFVFNLAPDGPLWYPGFRPSTFAVHVDADVDKNVTMIHEPLEDTVISPALTSASLTRKVSFAADIPRPIYISDTSSTSSSPRSPTHHRTTNTSSSISSSSSSSTSASSSSTSSEANMMFSLPPADHVTALLAYFESKSSDLLDHIHLPSISDIPAMPSMSAISSDAWDDARLSSSLSLEHAQATATESINDMIDFISSKTHNDTSSSSDRRMSISSILESAQASLQAEPAYTLIDYLQHPTLSFPASASKNLMMHDDDHPPMNGILNFFQSSSSPSANVSSSNSRRASFNVPSASLSAASHEPDLIDFIKKQDESFREFSSSFGSDILKPFVESMTSSPLTSSRHIMSLHDEDDDHVDAIGNHTLLQYLQEENKKIYDMMASSNIFHHDDKMIHDDVNHAMKMNGAEILSYLQDQHHKMISNMDVSKIDASQADMMIDYLKTQNQQLLQAFMHPTSSSSQAEHMKIEEIIHYLRSQQVLLEDRIHAFLHKDHDREPVDDVKSSPDDIIQYLLHRSPLYTES